MLHACLTDRVAMRVYSCFVPGRTTFVGFAGPAAPSTSRPASRAALSELNAALCQIGSS